MCVFGNILEEGRKFPDLILGNHVPLESDLLIQHDCPSRFEFLDLSGSAIIRACLRLRLSCSNYSVTRINGDRIMLSISIN